MAAPSGCPLLLPSSPAPCVSPGVATEGGGRPAELGSPEQGEAMAAGAGRARLVYLAAQETGGGAF